MTARRPIAKPPANLRQRRRADGTWRIWWEPNATARARGCAPVDLDAQRLTWSVRQAAALNDQAAAKPAPPRDRTRDIAALAARYMETPHFRDQLKPATRADYARTFKAILAEKGKLAVAAIAKPAMSDWYEDLYARRGPRMAQSMLAKMSVLMEHAERIGWRAEGSNPCTRLRIVSTAPRDRVATWDEIRALMAACTRAGPDAPVYGLTLWSMGAAIALALYQGQRQADVLSALLDDFGPDAWSLTRSKRGNAGVLALHPDARPWVEAAALQARTAGSERLIVYEGTGAPYSSADHFRQIYGLVREVATRECPSVADLQFRDLRRTCSQLAEDGGADKTAIARLLGNDLDVNPRLARTYTPGRDDAARRAVGAIRTPGFARVLAAPDIAFQSTETRQ